MGDLTRERREELRRDAEDLPDSLAVDSLVFVTLGELRALLDAADELDRLREAYQHNGGQTFTMTDCTFEYRPLTDEERAEIDSLNAARLALAEAPP